MQPGTHVVISGSDRSSDRTKTHQMRYGTRYSNVEKTDSEIIRLAGILLATMTHVRRAYLYTGAVEEAAGKEARLREEKWTKNAAVVSLCCPQGRMMRHKSGLPYRPA